MFKKAVLGRGMIRKGASRGDVLPRNALKKGVTIWDRRWTLRISSNCPSLSRSQLFLNPQGIISDLEENVQT